MARAPTSSSTRSVRVVVQQHSFTELGVSGWRRAVVSQMWPIDIIVYDRRFSTRHVYSAMKSTPSISMPLSSLTTPTSSPSLSPPLRSPFLSPSLTPAHADPIALASHSTPPTIATTATTVTNTAIVEDVEAAVVVLRLSNDIVRSITLPSVPMHARSWHAVCAVPPGRVRFEVRLARRPVASGALIVAPVTPRLGASRHHHAVTGTFLLSNAARRPVTGASQLSSTPGTPQGARPVRITFCETALPAVRSVMVEFVSSTSSARPTIVVLPYIAPDMFAETLFLRFGGHKFRFRALFLRPLRSVADCPPAYVGWNLHASYKWGIVSHWLTLSVLNDEQLAHHRDAHARYIHALRREHNANLYDTTGATTTPTRTENHDTVSADNNSSPLNVTSIRPDATPTHIETPLASAPTLFASASVSSGVESVGVALGCDDEDVNDYDVEDGLAMSDAASAAHLSYETWTGQRGTTRLLSSSSSEESINSSSVADAPSSVSNQWTSSKYSSIHNAQHFATQNTMRYPPTTVTPAFSFSVSASPGAVARTATGHLPHRTAKHTMPGRRSISDGAPGFYDDDDDFYTDGRLSSSSSFSSLTRLGDGFQQRRLRRELNSQRRRRRPTDLTATRATAQVDDGYIASAAQFYERDTNEGPSNSRPQPPTRRWPSLRGCGFFVRCSRSGEGFGIAVVAPRSSRPSRRGKSRSRRSTFDDRVDRK